MTRTVISAVAVLGALATSAPGQPARGKLNPESAYQTNVQLATGRLIAEVQGLMPEIARTPATVQREITPRAEKVLKLLDDFARTVAQAPTRERLRREYGPIDVAVKDLIDVTRRHMSANQKFIGPTSAISAANIQLEYAVVWTSGTKLPGTDNRDLARRLARQLETQAEALLEIARSELPANRPSAELEREIRAFESAASKLALSLGLAGDWEAAKVRFADLRPAWTAAVRLLRALPIAGTERTRAQASRVDRLYRNLAQIFDPDANIEPAFSVLVPHKDRSLIAIGAGEGGPPTVRLYQTRTGQGATDFMPYDSRFRGGVRVAVADVTGDGVADVITAPGPGMPPLVRIFDGRDLSLINEFLAYEEAFTNGLFVAAGDIDKDGRSEIVTGADAGGSPHVRIFDGRTGKPLRDFMAYDRKFTGGVRVALGDVSGNGVLDIVTAPGKGAPPLVRVFDPRLLRPRGEFLAYDPKMNGGVWVAAADITRNGRAEIVTGADQGGPHVRVFQGLRGQLLTDFFAYDKSFPNGVRVAVQDVNRDGYLDIVTAPGAGAPVQVRVFDGRRNFAPADEFLAFPSAFKGGAFISTR